MPKYIRIDNESDLAWIQSLFERQLVKSRSGKSKIAPEDIEVIERLAESFNKIADVSDMLAIVNEDHTEELAQEIIEKEAKPKRKRRTKAEMAEERKGALCKKHPKYTAQRAPRSLTECKGCWAAYKRMTTPYDYERARKKWLKRRREADAN